MTKSQGSFFGSNMAQRTPIEQGGAGGPTQRRGLFPRPSGGTLGVLVQPMVTHEELELVAWVAEHRDWIASNLLRHGALLFRHFRLSDPIPVRALMSALGGTLYRYLERSSPRREEEEGVYTSTEYPGHQTIALHNENSYARSSPRRLIFHCEHAPDSGGETLLADSREVLRRLPESVVTPFQKRGVRYVRTLGLPVGTGWQETFQTSNRELATSHCQRWGYEYKWLSDEVLQTSIVKQAVYAVPETSELTWFNHVAFFHESSLDELVREELLRQYGHIGLPTNVYFGDGAAIEYATVDVIRRAYSKASFALRWMEGDVLLVDNLLTAHGRKPFSGRRRVLVGMLDGTEATA